MRRADLRRLSPPMLLAIALTLAGLGPLGAAPGLAPGVLLYSAPHLGDPFFSQSVVLLVHHGDEGAMGLVINSPTRIPAAEALSQVTGIERLERPLYYGGPVQPQGMLSLIRYPGRIDGARRVLDDVHLTGGLSVLGAALERARPSERVRIFAGHAGWARGQLEAEVARGDWLIAPGDAETVFSGEPERLWERVYELAERIEARARLALPGRL